jgi:hypothetical protein
VVELAKWQNYYVITGSASAALVAIQFVVITLIATMRVSATAESINAFGTPNVVHFGTVLLVSAIMAAPWPSLGLASIALATCGIGGFFYSAIVILRARRQTHYTPVWDDWLWYTIVPCGLYASVALAALSLRTNLQVVLFVIAGSALGLLLIGIRNAWDSVTHIVVTNSRDDRNETA